MSRTPSALNYGCARGPRGTRQNTRAQSGQVIRQPRRELLASRPGVVGLVSYSRTNTLTLEITHTKKRLFHFCRMFQLTNSHTSLDRARATRQTSRRQTKGRQTDSLLTDLSLLHTEGSYKFVSLSVSIVDFIQPLLGRNPVTFVCQITFSCVSSAVISLPLWPSYLLLLQCQKK